MEGFFGGGRGGGGGGGGGGGLWNECTKGYYGPGNKVTKDRRSCYRTEL